jgi:PPP family 3-phenylpropionic acid transporter
MLGALAEPRRAAQSLRLARGFYACYYGASACLMPFLAVYYSELGFSGAQIGVLRGIAPVVTLIAAPVWSALADVTRRHKLLWLVAIAGSWMAALALASTSSFATLIAIVIAHAMTGAPVMPLADSAVIALLGTRRDLYGAQRLWGAIGWGLSGLLMGFVTERFGLAWSFVGYLVLLACGGAIAVVLPVASPPMRPHGDYTSSLRRLLSSPAWLAFLASSLFGGLYLTIEVNFLMLYMASLGAGESLMGIALVVSTLGELPIWALAPFLLRRLGPRRLLAVALLSGAVQGLAFSLVKTPLMVLPVQLLHGLAFSAAWTAGVAYVASIAPEGTQATAQGLYGGTMMGLASAIGAVLGGRLFDLAGGAMTFRWAALMPLIALVLLWLGRRRRAR